MRYLFLSLLVVVIAACNKPVEPGITTFVTSDTLFKIVNSSFVDLQVDAYLSQSDRGNGSPVFASCFIPANDTGSISVRALSKSDTSFLYFDIYTPDHSMSNWGTMYYRMPVPVRDRIWNIPSSPLSGASYYFLDANSGTTRWKAIDKRSSSNVSSWSTLDENMRYIRVTISKENGYVSQKDVSGNVITDTAIIEAQGDSRGITWLSLNTNIKSYSLANIKTYYETASLVFTRDTISLYDPFGYWLLVRE